MHLTTTFNQRLALLMLCVMVFGALAPTVSRAMAARTPAQMIEICTSQGMKFVALAGGEQKDSQPAHVGHDAACGYCILMQHSPALLTAPPEGLPAHMASGRIRIGGGATTVFARATRNAHPPRAPPTARV